MPAGLVPDNRFLMVPSAPGIHRLENDQLALAVLGVQGLLQYAYSFSQLTDLLERFFLAHASRLIGVDVGKADRSPAPAPSKI